MSTHAAVVTVAPRAPLEIHQVPTSQPGEGEVRVRNEWTASTPIDLHQADGGLLVQHPQILGDGIAGTVVEVGPGVKNLKAGDKVFGFCWKNEKQKAHQVYAVVPEYILGKVPANTTLQEAVTLPNNVVTVFHAMTTDLGITLPWPKPADYKPADAAAPFLIWGGSSSSGQYAIQVLTHWGYTNITAVSSARHHELLRSLGASHVFDYNDPDVVSAITKEVGNIPYIFDCIGSQKGSLAPLAKIARKAAKVAVLLPVVVRDATEEVEPIYGMDVRDYADWTDGVEVRGVRTHFYLDNKFYAEHLQPEIMPTLLEQGIIKPNKQRIVEGPTLLSRAQAALDILRRKEVSGERLVWRVADEE
ncbi:hypothetical protein H2203_005850 [Taxawa tesnikishii (nom. ined.)]|nr:hypothetical protein H2203_005850 [Dothideales sp. JES 119]